MFGHNSCENCRHNYAGPQNPPSQYNGYKPVNVQCIAPPNGDLSAWQADCLVIVYSDFNQVVGAASWGITRSCPKYQGRRQS